MASKPTIITILILAILLIIGGVFFVFQTTIGSTEFQLKQEYVTYWADGTDGKIDLSICKSIDGSSAFTNEKQVIIQNGFGCVTDINQFSRSGTYYEDDKWVCTGSGFGSNGAITLVTATGAPPPSCNTKQTFKGQEVVVLLNGGLKRLSGTEVGSCNVRPAGRFNCQATGKAGGESTCSQTIIKYIPHTFDTSIYDVVQDGIKTGEVNIGDGFKFGISCSGAIRVANVAASLDFIGFKAEFTCDYNANEVVWLTERYGSRVNIDDLTFFPIKLCYKDRPPLLITSQGSVPIFPDPFIDLNARKTIPERELTADETIEISYGAFFVEGVIDPLPLDQRYICTQRDSNNKCSNWIAESFVEPLTVIVQCETNADCPIPLKNQCPNYFQGCQNNVCIYDETILESVECKNEIVTIVIQTEIVKEQVVIETKGDNVFTFSQNKERTTLNFGDAKFTASIPSFSCQNDVSENDFVTPPTPRDSCWKTTAFFDGNPISIQNKEEKSINEFIDITYIASGTYILNADSLANNQENGFTTNYRRDNWGNTFVFNVKNAFEIDLDEDNKFVLLNSDKEITLTIKNNLPRNTNAFVKVKQTRKQTGEILEDQRIPIILNKGDNTLKIPIDTDGLDINRLEFEVFYVIEANNEVLIKSDKIITNYDVVTEIPSQTEFITIEKIVIVEVEVPVKDRPPIGLIVGIILGVMAFLIILAFIITRKG